MNHLKQAGWWCLQPSRGSHGSAPGQSPRDVPVHLTQHVTTRRMVHPCGRWSLIVTKAMVTSEPWALAGPHEGGGPGRAYPASPVCGGSGWRQCCCSAESPTLRAQPLETPPRPRTEPWNPAAWGAPASLPGECGVRPAEPGPRASQGSSSRGSCRRQQTHSRCGTPRTTHACTHAHGTTCRPLREGSLSWRRKRRAHTPRPRPGGACQEPHGTSYLLGTFVLLLGNCSEIR